MAKKPTPKLTVVKTGLAKHTISVVGAETLLGREIRDVIATRHLPYRVHLMGAAAVAAELPKNEDDEVTLVMPIDEALLAESELTILAEVPPLKIWERCPYVVDATGTLAHQPRKVQPIEHAVASAVASFLMTVHRANPVHASVIQAFVPASEAGQVGVAEMQKQAVSLLSFRGLPIDIFDTQVAFNMTPRYGSEAKIDLGALEHRIRLGLTTLLAVAGNPPAPSFRLSHSPVFHGYSLSAWVEFHNPADAKKLSKALSEAGADVRGGDVEPPSTTGVAGERAYAVGAIEGDSHNPKACWFWIAADAIRIAAENAVDVVEEYLRNQPYLGAIQ